MLYSLVTPYCPFSCHRQAQLALHYVGRPYDTIYYTYFFASKYARRNLVMMYFHPNHHTVLMYSHPNHHMVSHLIVIFSTFMMGVSLNPPNIDTYYPITINFIDKGLWAISHNARTAYSLQAIILLPLSTLSHKFPQYLRQLITHIRAH